MNDDNTKKQDPDQNDYATRSLDDETEASSSEVDATDPDKLADIVAEEAFETEDGDEVSLNSVEEEDDDDEHNQIGDLLPPGVDEGTDE